MGELLRREVAGVPLSVMPLREAIAWVADVPEAPRSVHFAPAFTIALAQRDARYRSLLGMGDAVFSDGMPVVWAGRRLYPDDADRWERVYGPDVMRGVLSASGERQRHYLLGGSPDTLERLSRLLADTYPEAWVVGVDSPPFREPSRIELLERDARIRASGATHVWVGLGTPRHDWEARRLADTLPVTALAVGAAFNFLAGTVPQAPTWMQRSGLEWAYRLAHEPRRLAGRYLWGNPVFVAAVTRQVVAAKGAARQAARLPERIEEDQ